MTPVAYASIDSVLATEVPVEEMVEDGWKMFERGLLRLLDDGDGADASLIRQTVTSVERAPARMMGAKLFATRPRPIHQLEICVAPSPVLVGI